MKHKLLYIDDELINLQVFKINFSRDYEVLTVDKCSEGFNVLDANPDIAIIISDMKMPEMNGLEFISKAKEKYPSKKFYILTGFDVTSEIENALKTGLILKYFKKPFNYSEIKITLETTLNSL